MGNSISMHGIFRVKFVVKMQQNKFDYCHSKVLITLSHFVKVVSDNLSWRLHYQTITSKAYKSLGLLRCIFNAKQKQPWAVFV